MTGQLELDFRAPVPPARKARATDPRTSLQAAADALPRQGSQRARILAAIAARPAGMTYDDVALELELRGVSVSTRISELARAGWIDAAGERRTSAGSNATVWVATRKAHEELATKAAVRPADASEES